MAQIFLDFAERYRVTRVVESKTFSENTYFVLYFIEFVSWIFKRSKPNFYDVFTGPTTGKCLQWSRDASFVLFLKGLDTF